MRTTNIIDDNAIIMIVGQNPLRSETGAAREPFAKHGPSGRLICELLDCYPNLVFTNVVREPVRSAEITQTMIDRGAAELQHEINELHPIIIICLGSMAAREVGNLRLPNDCRVEMLPHPSHVIRFNKGRAAFIERLLQIVSGKDAHRIKFMKTRSVKSPTIGTAGSAGVDFYVPNDYPPITIDPGRAANIPSGIKANLSGKTFIAFNKSGVATKKGLSVGACVIDSDYQGEIHLHVMNVSDSSVRVEPGDKILQFVLLDHIHAMLDEVEPEDLFEETSARGAGGFGSTGNN